MRTDKPGITIIVGGAGEKEILHVLGRGRSEAAPKQPQPDD